MYSAITNVAAYPDAVSFRVSIQLRPGVVEDDPRGIPPMMRLLAGLEGSVRLGIGFAYGRKAVAGRMGWHGQGDPPEGPLLMPGGGGGGGDEWGIGLWLWPLPPPGPMSFVCAWEELGVAEHEEVRDATELVEAAGRAEKLWDISPEDLRRGRGLGSSSGITVSLTQEPPAKQDAE